MMLKICATVIVQSAGNQAPGISASLAQEVANLTERLRVMCNMRTITFTGSHRQITQPCCDVSSLWECPFWLMPFLMTEYINKAVKLFLYLSLAPWILWGTGGLASCILNLGNKWVDLPSFLLGRFISRGIQFMVPLVKEAGWVPE